MRTTAVKMLKPLEKTCAKMQTEECSLLGEEAGEARDVDLCMGSGREEGFWELELG